MSLLKKTVSFSSGETYGRGDEVVEKAVYWIKKKIFQEIDFDDNILKNVSNEL